ncbi:MAG: Hpt domain-containing protein [Planctomycetota bacterium]
MSYGTGDLSMLELFRIEAQAQSTALDTGLQSLVGAGGDPAAADGQLETLLRAAHSVKGAATLVRLPHVIDLALGVEALVVAMQQRRLTAAMVAQPLGATIDFLQRVSQQDAAAIPAWISERLDESRKLATAMMALISMPTRSATSSGSTSSSGSGRNLVAPAAPGASAPTAGDDPMIELFRAEVESQLEALNTGLLQLEKGDTGGELLETLMRAAHSIKGAARLVELDPAVALAHALEDVFSGFQQGAIRPSQALVDALLEGLDVFARIGRVTSSTLAEWLNDQQQNIDELQQRIVQVANGHAPAGAPVAPAHPGTPTSRPFDAGMLGVFRAEVEAQTEALNDGLLRIEKHLEKGTAPPDVFNRLMSAMHTIKGAARLVRLDRFVTLTHRTEDALGVLKAGTNAFPRESIDTLLAVVDLIVQFTGVHGADAAAAWLADHTHDFDRVMGELDEIAGSTGLTTVAPLPAFATDAGDDAPALVIDASMFDLARGEMKANLDVLTSARDLDSLRASAFEPLVRAMHSMKGTLRILGIEPLSAVATSLEEQLRRVYEGKQPMTPALRECLRAALRHFDTLRGLEPDDVSAWIAPRRAGFDELAAAIMRPFAAAPATLAAASSDGSTGSSQTGTRGATESSDRRTGTDMGWGRRGGDKVRERYLRVTSEHLDHLMALSGESLVEARRLTAFNDQMIRFKQRQQQLFAIVHDLLGQLGQQKGLSEHVEDGLKRSRRLLNECRDSMNNRIAEIDMFAQRQTGIADRFHREVMDSRMRPFSDGTRGFPRMVRDVARQLGKQVQLEIDGEGALVDREILEKIEAPINHMLRNAVDHGIEPPEVRQRAGKPATGRIRLIARHSAGMLQIVVADDGRGVDLNWLRDQVVSRGLTSREIATDLDEQELLEFLFLPNFSTTHTVTDISGRGVGLNVVQDVVRELGGRLRCRTSPGEGLEIEMLLPISVSVLHALLVEIGGEPYAFPLSRIDRTLRVPQGEVQELEGRQYVTVADKHLGLVAGAQVLELGRTPSTSDHLSVVVIGDQHKSFGVIVDRLVGQHELVVQAIDTRLGKVKDVSAAALLDNGAPALILDIEDLLRSIEMLISRERLDHVTREATSADGRKRMRILVVDDSITVREVQRKLLTAAGYEVEVAVDGMDGWNAVRTHDYDMVISDIDMPRMNGIEFVRHIKNHPVLKALPVLIVSYKDREEDRQAGLEAGADYYLTKSSFQDETLIEAVYDLIGAPGS